MRRFISILFVAAVLLLPHTVEAQTCGGFGSVRTGPWQFVVGPGWTSNTSRLLTYMQRAFGETILAGGYSISNIKDIDAKTNLVFGALTQEFPLDPDHRSAICVGGEVGYFNGPNVAPIDISGVATEGTALIGATVVRSGGFDLIPTAGLSIIRNDTTISGNGLSEKLSDTSWLVHVGVGFLFAQHVAIVPSVSIPTQTNREKEVTVMLGITF